MTVVDSIFDSSRTALVLFGTETGTSQDLASEVGRILERLRFVTDVDGIDDVSTPTLAQYTIVVFVIATTGQGDFPSNARRFWRTLLLKRLSSTFLSGLDYALVGLGDSSYPKFNLAARKLHKRLTQLGATCLLPPCEADEQGEDSTDGAFLAWSQTFRSKILELFPLPDDQKPIPDAESLQSKWTLAQGPTNCRPDNMKNGDLCSTISISGPSLKTSDAPFQVTLEQNDRVTSADHWQDVRFLKLRANERVQYYPGDALAIRPKNSDQDVQDLIQLMQWDSTADAQLHFQNNRKGHQAEKLLDPALSAVRTTTLRQLLTDNLDIKAIPRRSFFAAIANYTTDDMHKERLLEFTNPQYLDEYYDYATRPRRSVLEVLQEFGSVKIPWQEVINVFPVLRPRQFSVASGGSLKEEGTAFDLLVAIVKYRTVIKRTREGTCTRYLANLPVGSTFEVVLKTEGRFHKPEQLIPQRHLLIGGGTGIAPLRAIIHEKAMSDSCSTLIFGCRNSKADYFFQPEWQGMNANGSESCLQVLTAFSRDQKQKVYVQDKIRENGSTVLGHLLDRTSTVVVCGSSGAMPKAVRQAFVDILCSNDQIVGRIKLAPDEAECYLARMEKEGRYKQETW